MRAWIAILLVGLCTPAFADKGDKAAAERYFRAGAKAYAAQNFAAAAQDFDEAYKAMELPEIAFSAAQAYRRLYRVDPKPEYVKRSVELYRVYLARVKTGGRVGDAADSLGEMERELEKVKPSALAAAPEVAHTRIGVNVTLADQATASAETSALHEIGDATGVVAKGLAATIDGNALEPFALVEVDAKEHVIKVSADGYLPVEKKALAVAGQSQMIDVELRPKPAQVAVATEAGAELSIDGRVVATASGQPVELTAGKHLLAITHRGREPFVRELSLGRGEQTTVQAPLEKTGRRRAVPWVIGGAGVLATGAVITALVARSHDSDASKLKSQIDAGNRPPGDADAYDSAVTSRDHYLDVTYVLGGAAIAAGAVAAGLYFFDHRGTESVRVQPIAGRSGGGVALSGIW